jgi:hypothetical protein
MNPRHKRFILKLEGVRESRNQEYADHMLYVTLPRHVQYKPLYPLPPTKTKLYLRTGYRTPQRNPLLSLGPGPPQPLHLEKHMIITPRAPPAPLPKLCKALQAPLLSSHFATSRPQKILRPHIAPTKPSAPENLPTYPARSTIPPSLCAPLRPSSSKRPALPTKKNATGRRKSKNRGHTE